MTLSYYIASITPFVAYYRGSIKIISAFKRNSGPSANSSPVPASPKNNNVKKLSVLFDFCTGSFVHNNIDEALDVLQFVAIKVHQEHAGASNAGTELNTGLGFLFGAHCSNPARMILNSQRGGFCFILISILTYTDIKCFSLCTCAGIIV